MFQKACNVPYTGPSDLLCMCVKMHEVKQPQTCPLHQSCGLSASVYSETAVLLSV